MSGDKLPACRVRGGRCPGVVSGTSPTLDGLRETGTVSPRDADHSDKTETVAQPRFRPEWEGFLRSKNTSRSSLASYNDARSEKKSMELYYVNLEGTEIRPSAGDKP